MKREGTRFCSKNKITIYLDWKVYVSDRCFIDGYNESETYISASRLPTLHLRCSKNLATGKSYVLLHISIHSVANHLYIIKESVLMGPIQ